MLGLGNGLGFNRVIGAPLLLDKFTGAAAAYSLRALSSTTTDVVRVRRSSDNAEQDFSPDEINDGSLATWVGAGNDGFVTTWYDQSGNSNDATQATAASQPKIVDAGALVEENGKPAVSFDGVDDGLQTSSYFANFLHKSESSVFAVASVNSGTSNGSAIISTSTSLSYTSILVSFYLTVDNRSPYTNRAGVFVTNGAGYVISNVTNSRYIDDQQYLISAITDPSNATAANRSLIYNDGANLLQGNSSTATPATGNSDAFLKIYQTGTSLKGIAQEIIIFDSDQSANRTNIETNINNHYSIY